MNDNQLKELPKLNPNTTVFGMNKQKITSVTILDKEYDIKTTTILNLSFGMNLKELPVEIYQLTNLTKLYLSNNQLERITS